MLDEANPVVQFKLALLETVMPAESAAVFGDMWVVEGGYAARCAEHGCRRVLLVDTFETAGWLERRAADHRLDFYKANFSNPFFMASVNERFSVSVAFDVLLHQAPLLSTIHAILEKTADAIVIAQPVLREQPMANSLVYLPGQAAASELYPFAPAGPRGFDVLDVNTAHWIWGMTPSFIRAVLAGEGFEVEHEASGGDCPSPHWFWWGCVARRGADNPRHWSRSTPSPGVIEPNW